MLYSVLVDIISLWAKLTVFEGDDTILNKWRKILSQQTMLSNDGKTERPMALNWKPVINLGFSWINPALPNLAPNHQNSTDTVRLVTCGTMWAAWPSGGHTCVGPGNSTFHRHILKCVEMSMGGVTNPTSSTWLLKERTTYGIHTRTPTVFCCICFCFSWLVSFLLKVIRSPKIAWHKAIHNPTPWWCHLKRQRERERESKSVQSCNIR